MNFIEQYLDSREVAQMVEKPHNDLMKDIRRYIEQLGEGKISHTDFFEKSTYISEQNKEMPCFKLSKKGCEFVANKLTGVKGAKFTALYINRFHEMEQATKKPMSALEQISLTQQAVLEVNEKVVELDNDLQNFKKDMPLLAVECETITRAKRKKIFDLTGGKNSNAYRDKSLRGKIYKDLESQLLREFGVGSYKAIKRSQTEQALDIIGRYELPLCLKEEVDMANSQMNLGV